MTREQRQLLLKDLCGRLLYGVKVQTPLFESPTSIKGITEDECWIYSDEDNYEWVDIEEVKPYLRPISSMTLVEKIELKAITKGTIQTIGLEDIVVTTDKGFDYLNAHHIDYRGLIPMGLALEAPYGMYKTE